MLGVVWPHSPACLPPHAARRPHADVATASNTHSMPANITLLISPNVVIQLKNTLVYFREYLTWWCWGDSGRGLGAHLPLFLAGSLPFHARWHKGVATTQKGRHIPGSQMSLNCSSFRYRSSGFDCQTIILEYLAIF